MDFALSEEQLALQGLAAEVLGAAADRLHGSARPGQAGGPAFEPEAWRRLAQAGLLGVGIPESNGGSGGGIVELAVLLEEAGRTALPLALHACLVQGALTVARFGTPEQRERWLRPVAAGAAVLTAAVGGPAAVEDLTLTSVRAADGDGWRLDGTAEMVEAASVARGILIPARTEAGPGVFVLDPGSPGVDLVPQPAPGAPDLFRVRLSAAPAEALGDAEDGTAVVTWMAERAAAGLCALQVGLAERALALTAGYVSTREQFGRPLGSFQAVQQRAADAYIDVECLRATTWRAVWRLGEGLPATDDVAVAAFWAAEAGHRVMTAAQHLHGGIGVDVDYPLHRYVLRAKLVELALGGANRSLARLGDALAARANQECAS